MNEYNDINKQMEVSGFSFKFVGSLSIRRDKFSKVRHILNHLTR